ncbi:MAG: hypothetical protein OM95_02575 [Bdellovibrio sp. ArHS]|uniref:hypothetical protein n=1 Tax=Bdellovibrio sp. ArHS TaxID=1569284 RepID=UPI000582473D|nr:hypothetical protein [Bdellovibrio sp. ArHS]KHD89628.1 MAG: hypothetical protein OM95_02575 [Bdellovibrio sp. ArHS]
MKFIYILEDDERIQKDLFDTLKSIDPKLHIRFFFSLAEFHEWLKSALMTGPLALAPGGRKYKDDTSEDIAPAATHELRLVVAKNEFFGVQNMGLIKRAREFFVRKKMCSEQEPTALILTAFDSPDFDIGLAEERIINNVIFKPFDKLILKQHLEYALTGHHPVTSSTVASMNIRSTIEMLKEVSLNSISEVGFTTLNNHEIKIGAMTKYYSDSFTSGNIKSVLAYCKSCKAVSDKEFLCEFLFFGADNKQVSQLRRNILQNKAHQPTELLNTHGRKTRILILDEDAASGLEIKNFFTDKFSNAEVFQYTLLGQLLSDLADKDTVHKQELPETFDLVFANYEIFEVEKQKRWEQIQQYLKDRAAKRGFELKDIPDLYLVSKRKLSFDIMKELSAWVKEIFFTPLDKSYMLKKVLCMNPGLLNKEATSVASAMNSGSLKVANPVEITQISEAGLVLKYYRAISIGAFREFILWRPEELDTPEIIGTVNFHEPDKAGGAYLNHFVFFGMKDFYLKHIRRWLLEAYIKTKDKE